MKTNILIISCVGVCVGLVCGAVFLSGSRLAPRSFETAADSVSAVSETISGVEAVADVPVTAVPISESVGTGPGTEEEPKIGISETRSDSAPHIVDRLVSFGFEDRSSRDIDTVIVHSSYDALGSDPYSVSGIIEEYRQYGVAAHYLIDRKGVIYRLVEDGDVAYHAGVSRMPDGRTGANAFSIGIELVEKDTDSPTSAQYAALKSLIASLKSIYPIKYVLGHSDIAPGRKTDPWGFDWNQIR